MKKIFISIFPALSAIALSIFCMGCSDGECPSSDPSYSIYIRNNAWWNLADLPGKQCYVRNSPLSMAEPKDVTTSLTDLDKDYYELNFAYTCPTAGCGQRFFTFKEGVGTMGINFDSHSFSVASFRFDPYSTGDLAPVFSGYYRTKCYDDDLCEVCNNNGNAYNATLWEFTVDPLNYEWNVVTNGPFVGCTADLYWDVFDEGSINQDWPEGVSCHCDLKYN